jgi:hypothetical protein
MTMPSPQRVITVSVIGDGENAVVYYSYISPVDGVVRVNSPVCDILVDRPIQTLYVLDYSATLNGWTISGTTPHDGSPTLETVAGAFNLSLMTVNPYKTMDKYSYYIHYFNTVNNVKMKRDPQEGNIPVPV